MTNPTTNASNRRSRGLTIALLLSLFLNIGLIGFLAGRWHNLGPTVHMPPPSIGIGRFLRGLDEARREELKPQLSAHFDSLRPSIRAGRKAHRAVRKAIAAVPFDPQTLEQALFELNSKRGSGAQVQASTLTNLVSQLRDEERAQLAASLERGRGHRGRSMRERKEHQMRSHRSGVEEPAP